MSMYSAYMHEFKIAMQTLARYEQTSLLFLKTVKVGLCLPPNSISLFCQHLSKECSARAECDGLSLAAFLLTPVQRLPRYELLLKVRRLGFLVKHTRDLFCCVCRAPFRELGWRGAKVVNGKLWGEESSPVARICLSIPVGIASVERSSQMKIIINCLQCRFGDSSLSHLMKIVIELPQKVTETDLQDNVHNCMEYKIYKNYCIVKT